MAIARVSDPWAFGQFSIAMAVYLFAMGLVRAAITETTLAVEPTAEVNVRGFRRAALVSLVVRRGMLAVGLIARNDYLIILGLAFNGLICLDYLRTVEAALYRARTSLVQGGLWSIATAVISVVSFVMPIAPLATFVVWAVSGSLIGYVSAVVARYSLLPSWGRHIDGDARSLPLLARLCRRIGRLRAQHRAAGSHEFGANGWVRFAVRERSSAR